MLPKLAQTTTGLECTHWGASRENGEKMNLYLVFRQESICIKNFVLHKLRWLLHLGIIFAFCCALFRLLIRICVSINIFRNIWYSNMNVPEGGQLLQKGSFCYNMGGNFFFENFQIKVGNSGKKLAHHRCSSRPASPALPTPVHSCLLSSTPQILKWEEKTCLCLLAFVFQLVYQKRFFFF